MTFSLNCRLRKYLQFVKNTKFLEKVDNRKVYLDSNFKEFTVKYVTLITVCRKVCGSDSITSEKYLYLVLSSRT